MDETAEYVGTSGAARRLGVSSQAVRTWLAAGRLPGVKTAIGTVMRVADVDKLAAERAAQETEISPA